MSLTSAPANEDQLRWRIPPTRRRVSLRFQLIQISFATVVVGVLVLLLAPSERQGGLFSAAIALALTLAAYRLLRFWQESRGPANVWLDDAGLHWRDAADREQLLPRSLAGKFYLGHDEETQRETTSLTLLLEGGFLSQPIELHPPATEATVRAWLRERWSLAETTALPDDSEVGLDIASEFDVHNQIWLFEGTRQALGGLAEIWSDAAKLPLPPAGARPKQIVMELAGQSIALAISPHTWIDGQLFAASPQALQQLSQDLAAKLSDPAASEIENPLVADTGHHWRLVFTVTE